MRKIIFTFILLGGILASFATNYQSIKGLKGDALKCALILDSKYDLSRDSLQMVIDMIRNYSHSHCDPESHYLLGVIYSEECGRYGRFFDILLEEYTISPIESGYNNESICDFFPDNVNEQPEDIYSSDEIINPSSYRTSGDDYYTFITTKAFDEFFIAANQGYAPAITEVAYRYAKGIGVSIDIQKALGFYEKATTLGDVKAYANLGIEYLFGGGIVDYNYDKAFYWLDKAYNNGLKDDYLSLCLGFCYEKGYGTPINIKKAVSIYEKTSHTETVANILGYNVGNFSIPNRLAILYYTNESVKDYAKAFYYLKFVADENVQELGEVRGYILRCLSACYRFGRGVKPDKELADFYLMKAGEFGNIDAQRALKYLYEK